MADIRACSGVDIVADLEDKLPFDDCSFGLIYSNQVLEHGTTSSLINESYRILKPGGRFVANVPYFKSSWAIADPTHVRRFCILL